MAIAIGVHTKANSTPYGTSTTITTPAITTVAGGTLFIGVNAKNVAISTVADSNSNSYALKRTDSIGSPYNTISLYTCDGGTVGANHTATVTLASAGNFCFFFLQVTGTASPSLDVVGGTSDSNSAHTTVTGGSVTTTNADDLILSMMGTYGHTATITPDTGNGWAAVDTIVLDGVVDGILSYRIVSATGTYNDTYTVGTGNYTASSAIALKQPSSGSAFATRKAAQGGMVEMAGGMRASPGGILVPRERSIFIPGMTRRAPRHPTLSL